MDINDIMKGVWVFSLTIGKPCMVIGIIPEDTEEGVKYELKLKSIDGTKFYSYLTGVDTIPIHPEFLLKNGFKYIENQDHISSRYVLIEDGKRDGVIVEVTPHNPPVKGVKFLVQIHTESSHDGGVNRIHSCDIESVHELQHAFKLCKIKKEIII